jgi:hypothetical protein
VNNVARSRVAIAGALKDIPEPQAFLRLLKIARSFRDDSSLTRGARAHERAGAPIVARGARSLSTIR